MVSEQEKAQVKAMIKSLYDFAAIPAWDGEITNEVAAVFGTMLFETQKCSKAFIWVPKPPGGRASITWLVRSLGRGLFNAHRNMLSQTCARAVIYKWQRQLDLAAMGLAVGRLPKWA